MPQECVTPGKRHFDRSPHLSRHSCAKSASEQRIFEAWSKKKPRFYRDFREQHSSTIRYTTGGKPVESRTAVVSGVLAYHFHSGTTMASGFLMLLDDIATILDDISVMTKVAAKKTAGILGDDLALNAEQVTGIQASRELPVVWAVAKGSFVNKVILVPSALLLSSLMPWLIEPLLIIGGAFLCFEGCEKLAHKFLHPRVEQAHKKQHESNVADAGIDLVGAEKSKIKGALQTDFILSAEIIVIALGTVATAGFMTQVGVLVAIGLLMTVGVYGLVAGIVKLDDIGLYLMKAPANAGQAKLSTLRIRLGRMLVGGTPYLMKFLSIAGTAAMFLVGGGILAHGIPSVHHVTEAIQQNLQQIKGVGGLLSVIAELAAHAVLGIIIGMVVLAVVQLVKRFQRAALSAN